MIVSLPSKHRPAFKEVGQVGMKRRRIFKTRGWHLFFLYTQLVSTSLPVGASSLYRAQPTIRAIYRSGFVSPRHGSLYFRQLLSDFYKMNFSSAHNDTLQKLMKKAPK